MSTKIDSNVPDFLAGARDYQREHILNHRLDDYHFLEWEMGVGKTFTIIREACYLWWEGKIDALVVIAPAGMYQNWLDVEWKKHGLADVPILPYTWKGKNTKKDLREREQLLKPSNDYLKVVVINMESVSSRVMRDKQNLGASVKNPYNPHTPHEHRDLWVNRRLTTNFKRKKGTAKLTKGAEFLFDFVKSIDNQRTMLVFDESEHITNPSNRTKVVLDVADHCKYRRALSGTAIRNGPFDLYHQLEFLEKGATQCQSFHLFKQRYGVWRNAYTNTRTYPELVEYRNLPELQALRRSMGSTIRKNSLKEKLPPKIFTTRVVEMTKEQVLIYVEMKRALMAVIEDDKEKPMIHAVNALSKLTKLHQITLGYVNDSVTGDTFPIKHHRIDTLLEVLREAEYAPTVIWTNHVVAIEEIHREIKNQLPNKLSATYYGATPKSARSAIIEKFQSGRIDFLIANPSVASFGLTLTRAEYMVFYSNSYKLTERLQSEDRPHRIGLKHPVVYVDLVCPGTVDEKVLEALNNKIDIASQIGVIYRDLIGS